jgi:hypothetical protein
MNPPTGLLILRLVPGRVVGSNSLVLAETRLAVYAAAARAVSSNGGGAHAGR